LVDFYRGIELAESYPINVYNGLITAEHRQRMGAAIWEYLWLLDHQTGTDGEVLGGRPIKAEEIASEVTGIGTHSKTVAANLRRLTDERYIKIKRSPYGLIIAILKPKKFSRRSENAPSGFRGSENAPSGNERWSQNAPSRRSENAPSNKTLHLDSTNAKPPYNPPYSGEFEEFWNIYPRKTNKRGAFKCWQARLREKIDGKPAVTASQLMAYTANYAEAVRGKEEQFILHASTFLGPNHRYRDYEVKQNAGTTRNTGNNRRSNLPESYRKQLEQLPQFRRDV